MTPTTSCASASGRTRAGRAVALCVLLPVVALAACGRSAPDTTLADADGDPEIAGVSITSPDAVVATVTTIPGETVPSTTEAADQPSIVYTVQPGDTLWVIADRYGISIGDLAAHNGISDVDTIKPGQQLAIPAPPEGTVPTTVTVQPDQPVQPDQRQQPGGTIEVSVVSQP